MVGHDQLGSPARTRRRLQRFNWWKALEKDLRQMRHERPTVRPFYQVVPPWGPNLPRKST